MKNLTLTLFLVFLWQTPSLAQDNPLPGDPSATTLSSRGDAARGKTIFLRCQVCHDAAESKSNKPGPHLGNLFGRTAGTLDGFNRYSRAMREADFIWTESRLEEWLKNPRSFLPGNVMAFNGMRREQDRLDLMAYLRSLETTQ